jgi:hypothetical protein
MRPSISVKNRAPIKGINSLTVFMRDGVGAIKYLRVNPGHAARMTTCDSPDKIYNVLAKFRSNKS